MAVATKEKTSPIPFNPKAFAWARNWRSRSYEEAANSLAVEPEQIAAWEKGLEVPTLRQARKLAEVYRRPFLEFFFTDLPDDKHTTLVPDFRLHSGVKKPTEDRDLTEIQEWAEETRRNAIDLFEILGEEVPVLPDSLSATLATDVEKAALAARKAIDFTIEQQLALKSSERRLLPGILRHKIELLGVLIVKESDLARFGARGLCVYLSPLPIVIFSAEAPSAQAFTITHEFAHVLLKQSAISGAGPGKDATTSAARVERWCNNFAAAFLIPETALAARWQRPARPEASIEEDRLRNLADQFGVSRHAMLLRLVDLHYVDASFYWSVMRPKFLAEEANYKAPPMRPKYYGSRYRSSKGDLYTGLVLEAWSTGRLTNHNAAEFMGIKNLAHLDDIRDNFWR